LHDLNLTLNGRWQPPPASAAPSASSWNLSPLSLTPENQLSFAALQIGKMRITDLTTRIKTKDQNLIWDEFQFKLFGGGFHATLQSPLAYPLQLSGQLVVGKLDQHQLFLALNPEKVDGTGTFSGTMQVALNATTGIPLFPTTTVPSAFPDHLSITMELVSDAPGRLMIKDEQTARQLAQSIPAAGLELLPDNYPDIVVGQLKNYPYTDGAVRLGTNTGRPVLSLQYHRPPLTPGEPGYGIKKVIQGQAIVANYLIQLSGVNIMMTNDTIKTLTNLMLNPASLGKLDSPNPAPSR